MGGRSSPGGGRHRRLAVLVGAVTTDSARKPVVIMGPETALLEALRCVRPLAYTSQHRLVRSLRLRYHVVRGLVPRAGPPRIGKSRARLCALAFTRKQSRITVAAEGGLPTSVLESLTQVSDMPSNFLGLVLFHHPPIPAAILSDALTLVTQ